jgi:hypothetical protein
MNTRQILQRITDLGGCSLARVDSMAPKERIRSRPKRKGEAYMGARVSHKTHSLSTGFAKGYISWLCLAA